MSLSNTDIDELIKVRDTEISQAINSLESVLLKDPIDSARAAFNFGRLEQLYLEFQVLLRNRGILDKKGK